MSQSQKRLVIALAVATVVVIVALAWYVTSSLEALSAPHESPVRRTEAPAGARSPQLTDDASATVPSPQNACHWQAAQLMAEAGLGGTVALTPGGVLRLDVIHTLAPGEPVDAAAQRVWIAFDVALALTEGGCGDFSQVDVSILVQGSEGNARIDASVSAADLIAYGIGGLSEDELIHRVVYQVSDD
jgi:hypothetical protein